jgi:putative transcriptional regulator
MTELRIGNNLKERRAEKKLTQADLAKLVGVSRKAINTVENSVFVASRRSRSAYTSKLDT